MLFRRGPGWHGRCRTAPVTCPHGHQSRRRPGRPGGRRGRHHPDHQADQGLPRHRLQGGRRARPHRVDRARSSACSGPNGAGKTTTAGMLTTRVIPTSGTAFVGGIDVVAHPALAKQLIGIVSQQNTLDRQLNVLGEPLLPRPAVRHGGQGVPAGGRRAARAVPAVQVGQAPRSTRSRAGWPSGSWWPGPSSTGRPCSSSTSPRPGSTPRAGWPCGRSCGELNGDRPDHPAHHPLHGGGRPAVRPGGHHGPRPDPGPRHPGRPQAERGRRHHRHRQGVGRPPRPWPRLLAREWPG